MFEIRKRTSNETTFLYGRWKKKIKAGDTQKGKKK